MMEMLLELNECDSTPDSKLTLSTNLLLKLMGVINTVSAFRL